MLTIGIKVGITTGKFKCTSQRGDIEKIEEEEGVSRYVVMVITYVLNLRKGESETVDLRYHPSGTMNH